MYNVELKQQFIESYSTSEKTKDSVRNIFKRIQPYEESWESDFCTMSTKVIQPVVDAILGVRETGKWRGISILREYSKWCILAKYPRACDGIMHVNLMGLNKIREQMVSSPLHLQQCLDDLFDPEAEETLDVIYRCYLWMAFGGMPEKDALLVKAEDIDFNSRIIRYGEKGVVTVYSESVAAFNKAAFLPSFLYKNLNYEAEAIRRNRVDGDTIMRGINSVASLSSIRGYVSALTRNSPESKKTMAGRRNKNPKQRLSYSRVKLSGTFFRIYELERADAGERALTALKALAEADMKNIIKATDIRVRKHMQNRKEKLYIDDYQRWKLAFAI